MQVLYRSSWGAFSTEPHFSLKKLRFESNGFPRNLEPQPILSGHKRSMKLKGCIFSWPTTIQARFSIGLWKLNSDGSRILVNGAPVPTYSNRRITVGTRLFTVTMDHVLTICM